MVATYWNDLTTVAKRQNLLKVATTIFTLVQTEHIIAKKADPGRNLVYHAIIT